MANVRLVSKDIKRCEYLDFSDDGNNFKGYLYKNLLPISALVYDGYTYIRVKPGYLGITYDVYKNYPIDNFNGSNVSAWDAEEFAKDCETIFKDLVEPNREKCIAALKTSFICGAKRIFVKNHKAYKHASYELVGSSYEMIGSAFEDSAEKVVMNEYIKSLGF